MDNQAAQNNGQPVEDNRHNEMVTRISGELDNSIKNVETPYGNIDILTNANIIILTDINQWEVALSKLYQCSIVYLNKQKKLYVYNTNERIAEMNKIKYILFTAFIFVACSESESIENKVTILVTTNVRGQLDPCG